MMENFVVFDISPFDDLNVLLDANMNGRYYHRRVSNPLTSMASLKLSVVVLYMHPINPKKKVHPLAICLNERNQVHRGTIVNGKIQRLTKS